MRVLAQSLLVWLLTISIMIIPYTNGSSNMDDATIHTNTIRFNYNPEIGSNRQEAATRALKKVFLTNRSITCNDGSQAGFYLRKSHTSKKWIIFLEGGWYCYDHHSCRNRWLKQRHYMTSSNWPETRDIGGILSGNMEENPFWFSANHVFVPYCTSDSWSGSRSFSRNEMFSFMGSAVVHQVVKDLISLGLENSTDLMLTGSSAGGTGVMLNLDPVKELLHDQLGLRHINVKGVTDSGWFLDRAPYAPTLKPAVEAIRKGMELWRGKVPRRCKEEYPSEPWRCYFGYRLYPTLQTELFVFQWLFDEAQMDADNVGAPVTKQQWDYIHKMGDALRHSFENVSAVFAPSCISHSVLTKRDWQSVRIDDISIAEALHCWELKLNKRKSKKLRAKKLLRDQQGLRKRDEKLNRNLNNYNATWNDGVEEEQALKKKKRKHKKSRKGKKRRDRLSGDNLNNGESVTSGSTIHQHSNHHPNSNSNPLDHRPQRSLSHAQNQRRGRRCIHRRLERCSWPQCNHSCPRLHNPLTGEEMDFIELLKSFGLDMESVASALGIDMHTLNNMDQSELLNLLTQQAN